MPNYRGHVIGGCIAYAALAALLSSYCISWRIAAEWFLCCFAGSLFPDIDTKSRGQKYFYWIILLIFAILIAHKRHDLLAIVSICAVVPLLVKHRGIFHHFWFVIAVPLLIWCGVSKLWPKLSSQLFLDTIFFIVGALSHLWLDFYLVPTMRLFGVSKKRTQEMRRWW